MAISAEAARLLDRASPAAVPCQLVGLGFLLRSCQRGPASAETLAQVPWQSIRLGHVAALCPHRARR